MDKSYADLLKENDLLKGTVQKHQETIERLESEVKRLNNELHKYKNENTLSLANKHLKGNTQGLHAKGSKRGAPFCHEGTTRKRNPDKIKDVDANYLLMPCGIMINPEPVGSCQSHYIPFCSSIFIPIYLYMLIRGSL